MKNSLSPSPTRMLYKYPGKHEMHGDKFDYIVVDYSEVDSKLDEGWHLTTDAAKSYIKTNEIKLEPNIITKSENIIGESMKVIDAPLKKRGRPSWKNK